MMAVCGEKNGEQFLGKDCCTTLSVVTLYNAVPRAVLLLFGEKAWQGFCPAQVLPSCWSSGKAAEGDVLCGVSAPRLPHSAFHSWTLPPQPAAPHMLKCQVVGALRCDTRFLQMLPDNSILAVPRRVAAS
jgi:hypothetical protein